MKKEHQVLDYFAPDPDTPAKIITVKYFYFESEARLYVARLRQLGIESFITNANTITAFPLGDGGIGLHIREEDRTRAIQVITELDQNNLSEARNFSFREADHEDIAYEKALHEQKNKTDAVLILFMLLLSLILIRAFTQASGINIWNNHF